MTRRFNDEDARCSLKTLDPRTDSIEPTCVFLTATRTETDRLGCWMARKCWCWSSGCSASASAAPSHFSGIKHRTAKRRRLRLHRSRQQSRMRVRRDNNYRYLESMVAVPRVAYSVRLLHRMDIPDERVQHLCCVSEAAVVTYLLLS